MAAATPIMKSVVVGNSDEPPTTSNRLEIPVPKNKIMIPMTSKVRSPVRMVRGMEIQVFNIFWNIESFCPKLHTSILHYHPGQYLLLLFSSYISQFHLDLALFHRNLVNRFCIHWKLSMMF